jgi:hypothetical protein
LSKTVDGAWIGNAPYSCIEAEDLKSVGLGIVAALEASKIGVPHPTEFSSLLQPLLAAANARTYSSFVRNTFLVEVLRERSRITFLPTRNEGARNGFTPIYDKAIEHEFSEDPLQIAEWAFGAIAECWCW